MSSKTSKTKYSKMDPLDHILHRPDTYVGSTRPRRLDDYVSLSNKDFLIINKNIEYCPALLRIFVEPLSNAIDNVARSKSTKNLCTKIKALGSSPSCSPGRFENVLGGARARIHCCIDFSKFIKGKYM